MRDREREKKLFDTTVFRILSSLVALKVFYKFQSFGSIVRLIFEWSLLTLKAHHPFFHKFSVRCL